MADLRLAEIYHEVDRNDDAVDALASGLEVVERLHTNFPDAKKEQRRIAGSWKANRTPKASTQMPKDPAKAERTLTRWVHLWETLAREHPSVDAFQNDLASAHAIRANWQTSAAEERGSGRLMEQGVDSYHKAIKIWERLSQSHPEVPEYRESLVMAMHELTFRQRTPGVAETLAIVDRELALTEQLVAQYPNVPQYRARLAGTLRHRGLFLLAAGKKREAGDAYRRQFDLANALFMAFPTVPDYALLAVTGATDFVHCSDASEIEGAMWLQEQLPPILTTLARLATISPDDLGSLQALANGLTNLGRALSSAGDGATAASAFQAAILLNRRLAQEGTPAMPANGGTKPSIGSAGPAKERPRKSPSSSRSPHGAFGWKSKSCVARRKS